MNLDYEIVHNPVGTQGPDCEDLITARYWEFGMSQHQTVMAHFASVCNLRRCTDLLEGYLWHDGRIIGVISMGQSDDMHFGEVAVPYIMYVRPDCRCPEVAKAMSRIRRELIFGMEMEYYIHPTFKDGILTYRKRGI